MLVRKPTHMYGVSGRAKLVTNWLNRSVWTGGNQSPVGNQSAARWFRSDCHQSPLILPAPTTYLQCLYRPDISVVTFTMALTFNSTDSLTVLNFAANCSFIKYVKLNSQPFRLRIRHQIVAEFLWQLSFFTMVLTIFLCFCQGVTHRETCLNSSWNLFLS